MKILFSSKKCDRLILKCLLALIFIFSAFSCSEVGEELEIEQNEVQQNEIVRSAKVLTSNDVSVSDNGNDGNIPQNTLDGNLNTRWSSRGKTGKYITYDLGSIQRIDEVKIAWFKGDERKTFFQIAAGNSTSSLTTILNKKRDGSSGNTRNLETYQLADIDARYIRIRGFGNSKNDWNSITEVQIITKDEGSSNGGNNNGNTSNGSVVKIPGTLEGENYKALSTGLRLVSGNRAIGYIRNNSYSEHYIDVPNSGAYEIDVYAASAGSGGTIDFTINGNTLSSLNVPKTNGWEDYRKVSTGTININSGIKTVRLVYKGSGSFLFNIDKLVFREKSSGGNNPDTGGGSTSGTPAGVLGGLRNWKLNGYSGTFRLGASNNGLSYVDKTPNLSTFSNNNWFFTDGTWTFFKAHVGNPTSSGSGNPRSELRELTADGSRNIFWDGTTNTEHSMKWKVRVDRLPQSGKVCFGQIHDKTDKFDDVIRIQCQGSGGQTSGSIRMRINGYVTEVLEGGGKTVGEFNMGEEMYLECTYQNSIVKLYELNSSGNRVKTIYTSGRVAAKENYFKAGAYLQSVKGKKARDINDFGLVGIKEIRVSH